MIGLSDLYQTIVRNAQQSFPGLPVGKIDRDAAYDQLHYAEVLNLNGTSIGTATIDRTGDAIGMSPVERCTLDGVTRWIPLEQLQGLRTTPFAGTAAAGRTTPAPAATPAAARARARRARAGAKPASS